MCFPHSSGKVCGVSGPPPNRLRDLRVANELTLNELAEETGIDKGALSRYERGGREFPQARVVLLADFFECSLDHLLRRDRKLVA